MDDEVWSHQICYCTILLFQSSVMCLRQPESCVSVNQLSVPSYGLGGGDPIAVTLKKKRKEKKMNMMILSRIKVS